MTQLLKGKPVSDAIKKWVSDNVQEVKDKYGWKPVLATIQIGENKAAARYIRSQLKACEKAGIEAKLIEFPENISKGKFIEEVKKIATDDRIDGIIIETPLPEGWELNEIISVIPPLKDVEGVHPENLGKLYLGEKSVPLPCTASAAMALLNWYGYKSFEGKHCVIVGRSVTVGRAATLMLMHKNGTVSMCHSRTDAKQKALLLADADVVIVATGRPGVVRTGNLTPNTVIIDIGTNVTPEGKLIGDVIIDEEPDVNRSPVPGGVGPITVALLLSNLLLCATKRRLGEAYILPELGEIKKQYDTEQKTK